jgi:maltose alpha-D-glucosyltransferase/alpha-amylase
MPTPSTLRKLLEGPLGAPLMAYLERDILPRWLPERRWFRSKARTIQTVSLETTIPLESGAAFCILRVLFTDRETEYYSLPLALETPEVSAKLPEAARIGPLPSDTATRVLIDACWNAAFRTDLFELLSGKSTHKNEPDLVEVLRGHPASSASLHGISGTVSRVLSAEQSNTAFVYGSGRNAVFVKLYRKLEPGLHPEPEMLRFLREHTTFRNVPEFYSALEWTPAGGTPATAALAQEFLPGGVNAWEYFLDQLTVWTLMVREPRKHSTPELSNAFLSLVTRMGQRVGEMHAALGSRDEITGFAPEPLSATDIKATRRETQARLEDSLGRIGETSIEYVDTTMRLQHLVKQRADRLRALLLGEEPVDLPATSDGSRPEFPPERTGKKIRTHGDLHLGQILIEGEDIRILDFEGEPGRTLAEARVKYSPLRDVAGMLRSFHYAAHVAHKNSGGSPSEENIPESQWAELKTRFLAGYYTAAAGTGLLPESEADRGRLLDLFTLEKALYELQYEWNNRPDWVGIPLHGLVSLAGTADTGTDSIQVSRL